jgi:hypothetical protein
MDLIEFNPAKSEPLAKYLCSEDAAPYLPALEHADRIVDGFQSPFGLELLATLDWLLRGEACDPTVASIRLGLTRWPGGKGAAERKQALFDDRVIGIALKRLTACRSWQPVRAAAEG